VSRRSYLTLYLLAVLIWGLAGLAFTSPTYFDSFYYFNAAESLAGGHGLTDQVLWNYLDDPAGLPRPSHLYWMPLASFLGAAGIRLFGAAVDHWRAAQLLMLLLSALIVPLAACLSWSISGRRSYALVAGALALFSGNYLGIWTFSDSYGPWTLAIGGVILATSRALSTRRTVWWLLAGVACGLAYLARADGLLLPAILVSWAVRRRDWRGVLALALGWALPVSPWCLHNLLVAGQALPVAGARTVWLHAYPELFGYGLDLSPSRYFAWGLGPILLSKLSAVRNTLEPALGAWPILGPLAAIGMWSQREDIRIKMAGQYWFALWLVMVLVFTFPAQHGSLYHSMAAMMPWQAALVPEGIRAANRWIAGRWPRWQDERFTRFFLAWLPALACIFAVCVFGKGAYAIGVAIQDGRLINRWQEGYAVADSWLAGLGVQRTEAVIVVDPPIFSGLTGRRAVVLPLNESGHVDFEALDQVALHYAARCLLLDGDPATVFADSLPARGWLAKRHRELRGQPLALFCREPSPSGS
jgi:hypothetical protein